MTKHHDHPKRRVLVGREAPDFTAQAVLGDGTIADLSLSASRGRYVVLFFWPLDNTFVCPTELIAFNNRLPQFQERNCDLVGVSIDSVYSHTEWRNKSVKEGGIGQVGFPMVSDLKQEICECYGVHHPDGPALRASFLIDREGIVRHEVVNDLPLGRNVDEMIRMVDALQFFEEHGEVCPAGWTKGQEGLPPTAEGASAYIATNADIL